MFIEQMVITWSLTYFDGTQTCCNAVLQTSSSIMAPSIYGATLHARHCSRCSEEAVNRTYQKKKKILLLWSLQYDVMLHDSHLFLITNSTFPK